MRMRERRSRRRTSSGAQLAELEEEHTVARAARDTTCVVEPPSSIDLGLQFWRWSRGGCLMSLAGTEVNEQQGMALRGRGLWGGAGL